MMLRQRAVGAAAALAARTAATAAAARRAASSTATEPPVLYAVDALGRATITLNAPRSRNALSSAMMTALADAVDRAAGDRSLKLVVLRAAGPAFSAGHDLKQLRALQASGGDTTGLAALFAQCTSLMLAVGGLPVPVVGAVGPGQVAAAAGCQLAASCDVLYAAPSARFSTPGVNIGLFCSTPGVALARAAHAKVAAEALFSGREYSAAEMAAAGLVTRVLPPEAAAGGGDAAAAFDASLDDATAAIASKPASVLRLGKAALAAQLAAPGGLAGAYAVAEEAMVANLTWVQECAQGLDAFIAKRPVPWAAPAAAGGGGGH
jgi:enoyl-CoA hydratase/carnithine racemase